MRIQNRASRTRSIAIRPGTNTVTPIRMMRSAVQPVLIRGGVSGSLVGGVSMTWSSVQSEAWTTKPGKSPRHFAQKPETAEEWVQQNLSVFPRYAGQWVAVSEIGIVAHTTDFDEVFFKAREQGIMTPLVFKVPKPRSGLKFVSAKHS